MVLTAVGYKSDRNTVGYSEVFDGGGESTPSKCVYMCHCRSVMAPT